VYFAVFVGLFQMAVLTGYAIFVFGFIGMWLFAGVDAWRTAQMIRSGLTPDGAEDILVRRFSGNPKLWGIVLTVLGAVFFLNSFFNLRFLMRGILPVLLIGLGVYLLRNQVFKSKQSRSYSAHNEGGNARSFAGASSEHQFVQDDFESQSDFRTQTGARSWKNR
jgi:hypothetical protein